VRQSKNRAPAGRIIVLKGHAFGVGAERAMGNRDYFLNKAYGVG